MVAHRRVLMDTGRLLVVFIVGSFATIAGTLAAAKVFPLTALGADGWKAWRYNSNVQNSKIYTLKHQATSIWSTCFAAESCRHAASLVLQG